jgi:hypothetical protein
MEYADLMSYVRGGFHNHRDEASHAEAALAVQSQLQSIVEIEVPAKPLSEILEIYKVGLIDFLSLDVEGYEASVLSGWILASINHTTFWSKPGTLEMCTTNSVHSITLFQGLVITTTCFAPNTVRDLWFASQRHVTYVCFTISLPPFGLATIVIEFHKVASPKITFGIIVLNGEPFTRYCLRALYRFAQQTPLCP